MSLYDDAIASNRIERVLFHVLLAVDCNWKYSNVSFSFFSTQELEGNNNDLIRLSKKMLNKTTSNRVISKQECMVENTELPLNLCSELIQIVGITGSSRVTTTDRTSKPSMLASYAQRDDCDECLSFCQYVHKIMGNGSSKIAVPHFVGLNSAPSFPVTASYARGSLIIHIPWRNYRFHKLDDGSCIKLFSEVIDTLLPRSVKLNYHQAKNRYETELRKSIACKDSVNDDSDSDEGEEPESDDDKMVLQYMTTLPSHSNTTGFDDCVGEGVCTGKSYDWSIRCTVSSTKRTNQIELVLFHALTDFRYFRIWTKT